MYYKLWLLLVIVICNTINEEQIGYRNTRRTRKKTKLKIKEGKRQDKITNEKMRKKKLK